MRHISQVGGLLVVVLLSSAIMVTAQEQGRTSGVDLLNLEESVPMRIEDAYVLPEDAREAHLCINWGHGDGNNWTQVKTKLAWGMSGDVQGIVGMKLEWNDFDETGDGDLFVQALKQFHQTPHEAILGGVKLNLPTGKDYARIDRSIPGFAFVVGQRRDRVDPSITGVYTRILDPERSERLHVEMEYKLVRSAPTGSDDQRWFLAVGYDRKIGEDRLAMASVWWEEDPSPMVSDSAALQLGIRRKQSANFLWGLSINMGLGWEWAEYGLTVAGQYRF